jgi:hypothetical protein
MDAFTFDRLTRRVFTRRILGGAFFGALAGLLGLTGTTAAPCPNGLKSCKQRCIPKQQCCTTANCPKRSGKACRRGRCTCPKGKRRCQNRCIPKAACCRKCPPLHVCRRARCCIGTAAALRAALAPGGPAVIRLCRGTTYTGSFIIGRNVIIIGAGVTRTILSGGLLGRVVQVQPGVIASLVDLQITKGRAPGSGGGGLLNQGRLTLTRCLVTDNQAHQGGGINNHGVNDPDATLILDSTVVTNNRAVLNGGGIDNFVANLVLRGANVISGNQTAEGGRGGGIFVAGTAVILQDTTLITNNQAFLTDPNSGGGIYNAQGGIPSHLIFLDAARVVGNLPNNCTGPDCPA